MLSDNMQKDYHWTRSPLILPLQLGCNNNACCIGMCLDGCLVVWPGMGNSQGVIVVTSPSVIQLICASKCGGVSDKRHVVDVSVQIYGHMHKRDDRVDTHYHFHTPFTLSGQWRILLIPRLPIFGSSSSFVGVWRRYHPTVAGKHFQ